MDETVGQSQKAHKVQLASEDYNILSKGQQPELHTFEHHTELARKRGDKDIQISNGNIKTEYQKRLRDTREMKAKIQKHLDTLNLEMVAAERTRDGLLEMMTKIQRPLLLTKKWMEVRASEEAFNDPVNSSLQQSVHEVKDSVAILSGMHNEIESVLAELKTAETRYKKEIDSKDMTILLDKACMDDALSLPSVMPVPPQSTQTKKVGGKNVVISAPAPPTAGQDMKSKGSPRLAESKTYAHSSQSPFATAGTSPRRSGAPAGQKALMQSAALHTENEWRNQTETSISQGVATVEKSKAIRKRIGNAVASFESAGRTKRPVCVVDALQTRLKSNSHQCQALELNTKMIMGEMMTLEKQKAMLKGSLEKVYQQLDTAEKRLAVRVVKPPGEALRQGVEEVLEIEAVRMKQTEGALTKQLHELERKERRLGGLVTEMKKELTEKQSAIRLDTKCAKMDLPQLPQIASPRTPRQAESRGNNVMMESASATSSQRSAAKAYKPPPGSTVTLPAASPRSGRRK